MALFDKLKGMADKAKELAADKDKLNDAICKGMTKILSVAMPPEEVIDESTLEFPVCTDFELEECEEGYILSAYVGFDESISMEIPAQIDGKAIVALGDHLLEKTSKLQYLRIADGIQRIGDHAFDHASIKSVYLPQSLRSIGKEAFHCSALTHIELPDSVTSVGVGCFCLCKELKSVKLSNNLKSLPDKVFHFCDRLKNVTLPDSITLIGTEAHVPCSTIPEALETLGKRGIMGPARCDELWLPKTLRTIHEEALCGLNCNKLHIPAGLNVLTSLDEDGEPGTLNLQGATYTEIFLEPGSTYELDHAPFKNCENLEKLYIPATVSCEWLEEDGLFGRVTTTSFSAYKDAYGRSVRDYDGTVMGEHYTSKRGFIAPKNPNFVLYCEPGSDIYKFARENQIKCAKWEF